MLPAGHVGELQDAVGKRLVGKRIRCFFCLRLIFNFNIRNSLYVKRLVTKGHFLLTPLDRHEPPSHGVKNRGFWLY
jgi:hypothetical protein